MKISLDTNFEWPEEITSDWIKQELFVRTHYIDGLTREFEKIQLLPAAKRKHWINENQKLLGGVLDTLMFDSDLAMSGVELDEQAAQMSLDFATKLRNAAALMRKIVRDNNIVGN